MPQLYAIQVLRALAALMVAVHHIQPDAAEVAARAGLGFEASRLLPWMAGVDIFFVVSGFIMVHASRDLFGRPGGVRLFWCRRLARIVPLYWAATTLFLLVAFFLPASLNTDAPGLGQILGSYLFWPTVSTAGLVQPVYSLGWTLNYEMLFYALFGAALVLPRPLAIGGVALLLGALVATQAFAGPLPLPFGFWGQPIVLEFVIGMGLALLRDRGFRLRATPRWMLTGIALAILLYAARLPEDAGAWIDFALRGAAATLLVLAAVTGDGRSAPSALVRFLARLGDASYALYLVHPFAIRGLREVFVRALPGWTTLFVIAALAAAIVAALLVHSRFEKPATRLVRRWLGA